MDNNKNGVTINDVEYVAKLARLEFDEEEKQKLTVDLNNILKYIEKLSEVDTDNVEISISGYKMYNALRDDEIKPSMNIKNIMMNAPESVDGFIKVPTIIE